MAKSESINWQQKYEDLKQKYEEERNMFDITMPYGIRAENADSTEGINISLQSITVSPKKEFCNSDNRITPKKPTQCLKKERSIDIICLSLESPAKKFIKSEELIPKKSTQCLKKERSIDIICLSPESPVKKFIKSEELVEGVKRNLHDVYGGFRDMTESRVYHQDDRNLPVFEELQCKKSYSKKEKENQILRTVELLSEENILPDLVCNIPPRCVKQNRSFVVDTTKLKKINDVLADDCGSWLNTGQHKFYFEKVESGEYTRIDKPETWQNNMLTLNRHYYSNKSETEFGRTVSFITGKLGTRSRFTKIDYQFSNQIKTFNILAHGNSKLKVKPYIRTKPSTIETLKVNVSKKTPSIALDDTNEHLGGIRHTTSSGNLPRNIQQAYNMSKDPRLKDSAGIPKTPMDPYTALILKSKEQFRNPEIFFVRKVVCAPQPIVYLANQRQLSDLAKFCTNEINFSVLQIDPTFDLSDFSVTATAYDNLLLRNKDTKKPPVMIGPMMVHQLKDRKTFKSFADFLIEANPELESLKAIGTDGEEALFKAFNDVYPESIHLLCFIHFENNIKNKLKQIGVEESYRRQIMGDIFGFQVGTTLETGIVDSKDEGEFLSRFESLLPVWKEKIGTKADLFHSWFKSKKSRDMMTKMLYPVRVKAGLGIPPTKFNTNRVECVNSLLKREAGRNMKVDSFVTSLQSLVERQSRKFEWAVIGKGTWELHPSLSHFKLQEETWNTLSPKERDDYLKEVRNADVSSLCESPDLVHDEDNQSTNEFDITYSTSSTTNSTLSGLELLASAATNELRCTQLSVAFEEFKSFFPLQTADIIKGIYDKASGLVRSPRGMTFAPSCCPKSRIVASTSHPTRPNTVIKGKRDGEYKCEGDCANYRAMKCCSHVVATAESNHELKIFLKFYASTYSGYVDVSSAVKTGMPKNPGKKGGVNATRGRSKSKLPIAVRTPRLYHTIPPFSVEPFRLKQVNARIKVYRGCGGSIKDVHNNIPSPPYDLCIARMERNPFFDKTINSMRTPSRATDSHYHFRLSCVRAVEAGFIADDLDIPSEISLRESHKEKLLLEFNLQ